MSSQAQPSWQSGGAERHGGAGWGEDFPDQQSVESLLRRLVQQVEETERRYGEALDDLQRRLDQLAMKTDAARASSAAGDTATLDRLHDQVSGLARRFEREAVTSLDDFEALGRAVMGGLERGAGGFASGSSPAPFPAPFAAEPTQAESSPFTFPALEPSAAFRPFPPLTDADRDLSKRLVEMARRLEHSVDAAMAPNALDDLKARVDAMGRQIADALVARPKPLSLEPLERQIADIAGKLGKAEGELAKIGAIETALHRLIERVDGQAGQLGDVAQKAAIEAARLVSNEAKLDAATAERLDAMHRDLKAMNAKSSAADDRLTGIIESVHDSLKQLLEQAERSAARAPALGAYAPRPEDIAAENDEQHGSGSAESAEAKAEQRANQSRVETSSLRPLDARSQFGRAKPGEDGARAVEPNAAKPADRDTPRPSRSLARRAARTESEMEEDLVAAARRAAQAAALRAAERTGGDARKWAPSGAQVSSRGEMHRPEIAPPARRGWPLLVVAAAILLVLSAILLYSRLQTKPLPGLLSPAVEESAPVPGQNDPIPGAGEKAPTAEPKSKAPPAPSPSPVAPDAASNPARDAASGTGEVQNFTDIAKSSYWPATVVTDPAETESVPDVDESPQAEPAALQDVEEPSLPPGVVFTVEDPSRSF